MSEFGAGVYLTKDFDMEVDGSGDIRTTAGFQELEKDLSFALSRELHGDLGRRLDNRTMTEIQITARDVMANDPRINSVSSMTVIIGDDDNTVEIVTDVNTDDGPQELVIGVNE